MGSARIPDAVRLGFLVRFSSRFFPRRACNHTEELLEDKIQGQAREHPQQETGENDSATSVVKPYPGSDQWRLKKQSPKYSNSSPTSEQSIALSIFAQEFILGRVEPRADRRVARFEESIPIALVVPP